jgi:hypothetical protein
MGKAQDVKRTIDHLRGLLTEARLVGVTQAQAIEVVTQVFEPATIVDVKPKPTKSVNTVRHPDGRVLEFRILNGDALLGSYMEGRGANLQKLDRQTARQFYRRAIDSGFKPCERDPKAKAAIDDVLGDVAKSRVKR